MIAGGNHTIDSSDTSRPPGTGIKLSVERTLPKVSESVGGGKFAAPPSTGIERFVYTAHARYLSGG